MANYYLNHTAAELDDAINKVKNGYKDVSSVTAAAGDVAVGKSIVDSEGNVVDGTLDTNSFYESGYSQGLEDSVPTLQSKEAAPSTEEQTIVADKEYDGLFSVKISAMPQTKLSIPVITVDENGLITATVVQPEGYVLGTTVSATYQLPTHAGGSYEAKAQTISVKGKFMKGNITITAAPSYAVEAVSGAAYGFSLNSNGYYESNNKGVDSSAALCRVRFELPSAKTITFSCINYAESNYDFGILGLIDTALGTSYSVDSSVQKSFKGSSSASVQIVTYSMGAGSHFIDVKYRKDSSQSSNNDSLQFKVSIS